MMNGIQLINNKVVSMSSREIAELTSVRHDNVANVVKELIEVGILKNSRPHKYIHPQNKQEYTEYLCDKTDSLILVARLSPEFMAFVVKRWQELEQGVKPSYQIDDPIKRAEAWIAEHKEKVALELSLTTANNRIDKLTHTGKTYIATELAKELGIRSATAFNKILKEKGVQFKKHDTWLLSAKYADKGYGSIKQSITSSGAVVYNMQWTQAGREFILDLMKEGV